MAAFAAAQHVGVPVPTLIRRVEELSTAETGQSSQSLCAQPNSLSNPTFNTVGPNGSTTSVTTPRGITKSGEARAMRLIILPHTGAAMVPPDASRTMVCGRSSPNQTAPTSSGV